MRHLFLLLIILGFVSCSNRNETLVEGIPQDSILPKEQMILMLADLHIIEAAMQLERNKGKDPREISKIWFSTFFSRNKVSEKRFNASVEYYKQDEGEFIKLYEEVIVELEKRGGHIKSIPSKNPE